MVKPLLCTQHRGKHWVGTDQSIPSLWALPERATSSGRICGAKLCLSDALLLVVYLSAFVDKEADDLRLVFDGIYLLDFTPYGALTGAVAPLWVGLCNMADSPAVPFETWAAGSEGNLL